MSGTKMMDLIIAVVGFVVGIAYAFNGEWGKATFFMALATNCELGYRFGS